MQAFGRPGLPVPSATLGEVHASAAAAPTGPVLADPRPAGDVDRHAESPRARAAGPARLLLGGFTSS